MFSSAQFGPTVCGVAPMLRAASSAPRMTRSRPRSRCCSGAGQALVAGLAGLELAQVVRRGHAGGVEEILVLAHAARARRGALALGRDAEDGDLGLVDRQRPEHANLGRGLVHQEHVREQAQIAAAVDHPVRLDRAEALFDLGPALRQRAVVGARHLAPQQRVAHAKVVGAAGHLGDVAAADDGLDLVFLAHRHAPLDHGHVIGVHAGDVVAVDAVLGLQLPVGVVGVAWMQPRSTSRPSGD